MTQSTSPLPGIGPRPVDLRELAGAVRRLPQLRADHRATAARALIDDAKRVLSAAADEAVADLVAAMLELDRAGASTDTGPVYARAAQRLGVSTSAVNKAVTRHRGRQPQTPR